MSLVYSIDLALEVSTSVPERLVLLFERILGGPQILGYVFNQALGLLS